ncbi:uncharacterized protein LOC131053484 [Cryptomeria japonica]|uniref:uncharacterized protein LOC131053484 n=1 Tax=Cryptomeria japonica TaxID=3369 RepID=UPI0025AD19DD|nr:uncharacterized protein LOC131053484 [Cryptomeria japonica]
MYLQKIIQLQLDFPDPSDVESRRFLRGQLGVSENEKKYDRSSSNGGEEGEVVEQDNAAQIIINMETTITGKQKQSSSILREMLFVKYSKGEENAFLFFQKLVTEGRKHPRGWKRFLNYHRLVWYIFSASKEAKYLNGWQVQLITWIFICWEWQEYMNLVIEKWKEIADLETNTPSLLMIVEHLMDTKATLYESSENARSEKSANSMEKRLDVLENSLAELKKEMKELKELLSDEMKKDVKELEKQVSDDLKEDIRKAKEQTESGKNKNKKETKEQTVEQGNGKNEDMKEGKRQILKEENGRNEEKWNKNWERMKSTLKNYDVSMDGIQAFQRFRFYCIAGYLPPLGKDSENANI